MSAETFSLHLVHLKQSTCQSELLRGQPGPASVARRAQPHTIPITSLEKRSDSAGALTRKRPLSRHYPAQ